MPLVKVPGTPFVRDTKSMALLNMDINEKNEYYSKLRVITKQKEQINIMRDEIDDVKSELSSIKQMIQQLIDKE
jgi:uncharacterized coiled-coil DUF342 family protein